MNFIKRLFCRHDWLVSRWHWTHGPIGNDPAFIQIECQCGKCGKVCYQYKHGMDAKDWASQPGVQIFRE